MLNIEHSFNAEHSTLNGQIAGRGAFPWSAGLQPASMTADLP
jgi:hypothetical protein